MSREPF